MYIFVCFFARFSTTSWDRLTSGRPLKNRENPNATNAGVSYFRLLFFYFVLFIFFFCFFLIICFSTYLFFSFEKLRQLFRSKAPLWTCLSFTQSLSHGCKHFSILAYNSTIYLCTENEIQNICLSWAYILLVQFLPEKVVFYIYKWVFFFFWFPYLSITLSLLKMIITLKLRSKLIFSCHSKYRKWKPLKLGIHLNVTAN